MGTYSILFIFFFFLFAMFWTPYKLAKGIEEIRYEEKISFGEKILCFIPIFNVCRAEKRFLNKIGIVTISIIVLILSAVWRFVSGHFLAETNQMLAITGVYAILIAFAFYWIANCIFVFQVINATHGMSGWKMILFTVFYPLGQFYIGDFLRTVVKNRRDHQAKMEAAYTDAYYDDEEDEEYED